MFKVFIHFWNEQLNTRLQPYNLQPNPDLNTSPMTIKI